LRGVPQWHAAFGKPESIETPLAKHDLLKMTAEQYVARVKVELEDAWLPHIYRERIRSKPTRAYHFEVLPKTARVEIQHTLLGVELKAGRRRWLCPDLATARYLSVFARAGCADVAVPYDITRISLLADELESSWHRMFLIADHLAAGRTAPFKARIRRLLLTQIRAEVSAAGAGASLPEFKQSTKQRS
jgi:hypothetical protein